MDRKQDVQGAESEESESLPETEVREEISSGRIGGLVVAVILIVWFLSKFT